MSRCPAFDPQAYGPLVAELLVPERLPELGPGRANLPVRDRLTALTPQQLLADRPIADGDMARACIGGLWLYHDFLDESHRISQTIETSTGSYWHGIMHRREPDFGNAKYWFRRVGTHAIFPALAAAACCLAGEVQGASGRAGGPGLSRAAWLARISAWDPFTFIDTCEACIATPGPDHDLCRRISLVEWQLLFDYAYRHATGTHE